MVPVTSTYFCCWHNLAVVLLLLPHLVPSTHIHHYLSPSCIMFRPSKRSRFVGGGGEAQLLPAPTTASMMMNNSIATCTSTCWLDASSSMMGHHHVPSPFQQQQQHTPLYVLASPVTTDIFLERFQKEIINRFMFSQSGLSRLSPDEPFADARHRNMLLKKRITVGFNSCTKALQSWCYSGNHDNGSNQDCLAQTPSLVVVALDDGEMQLKTNSSNTMGAAAMLLAHIPLLAHQAGVPLLILPGPNASQYLTRLLMIHSGETTTTSAVTCLDDYSTSIDPNHRVSPRVTVMAFLPRDAHELTSPAGQVIHGAVDSLVDFFRSKAASTNSAGTAASCFSATAASEQCGMSNNKMIY